MTPIADRLQHSVDIQRGRFDIGTNIKPLHRSIEEKILDFEYLLTRNRDKHGYMTILFRVDSTTEPRELSAEPGRTETRPRG